MSFVKDLNDDEPEVLTQVMSETMPTVTFPKATM